MAILKVKDILIADATFGKREIQIQRTGRRKCAPGITIVEVMTVTVILTIVVLGTSGYRYYASLNARWAEQQMTQARLGQLFCGSWVGVEGDETYNPVAHLGSELPIEVLGPPKSLPPGFTLLGRYKITVEGVVYHIVLAWNDVSPQLRALNVKVTWFWLEEDPSNPLQPLKKPFTIITYVPK